MNFLRVICQNVCSCRTVSHLKVFRNSVYKNSTLKIVSNFRTVATTPINYEYEADGKTVGHVINKKNSEGPFMYIMNVSSTGFSMSTGVHIEGPVIMFPHMILSWHVSSLEEVTEESLCLFKVLEPKVDILIFGYGCQVDYTPEHRERITKIIKNLGIKHEVLPSDQACGVYNFLVDERRYVAAALLPPRLIDPIRWEKKKQIYIDDMDDEDDDEYVEKLLENIDKKEDQKFIK